MVVFIAQSIILWNTGYILKLLGQNQEVAMVAQTYVRYVIPGVF